MWVWCSKAFSKSANRLTLVTAHIDLLAEFGGIEILKVLDGDIKAFGDIINDRILVLCCRTFLKPHGETRRDPGGEMDQAGIAGGQVQHLLGEAADTVHRFEGIFISGHRIEIFKGVGFCPFPIFYKLIL